MKWRIPWSLPIWAYGIECRVCKTTFESPTKHYMHVIMKRLWNKHRGKIPRLPARR